MASSGRKVALVCLLASAVTLVFGVAQALAAATSVNEYTGFSGSWLSISADSSDNAITVSVEGSNILVTDSTAGVETFGTLCTKSGNTMVCPLDPPDTAGEPPTAPVRSVGAYLSNGNDSFNSSSLSAEFDVSVYGGEGNKAISTGAGDDYVSASGEFGGSNKGTNTIDTGAGDDSVSPGNGNDTVTTGEGRDNIGSSLGDDSVDAGPGSDEIDGGSFANGNKTLNGGGQPGDSIYFWGKNPVTVSLDGLANDGHAGQASNVIGFGEVSGSEGADNLVGDSNANVLSGGKGSDAISGLGGDDTINPGDDNDSVDAGEGNDSVSGGSDASNGADMLSGGNGSDEISYCCGLEPVSVNQDGQANDGRPGEGDNLAGFEGFGGGAGNDTITGSKASNRFDGGEGADLLVGRGGGDEFLGGPGDDTMVGGAGRDEFECGLGIDLVIAGRSDIVQGGCERTGATPAGDSAKVRKGKAMVKVSCPASEGATCKGKLTLLSNGKTIGKGKYRIKKGKTKIVKAKLTKKGLRALKAARGSLPVSADAKTTEPGKLHTLNEGRLVLVAAAGHKRR